MDQGAADELAAGATLGTALGARLGTLLAAALGATLGITDAPGGVAGDAVGDAEGEGEASVPRRPSTRSHSRAVQTSAVVSGPKARFAMMVEATERVPAMEPSRPTTTPVSISAGMSAVPLLTGVGVRLCGRPVPVASPQATTAASWASAVGGAKVVNSCWSTRICWTPATVASPPVTCASLA